MALADGDPKIGRVCLRLNRPQGYWRNELHETGRLLTFSGGRGRWASRNISSIASGSADGVLAIGGNVSSALAGFCPFSALHRET